MMFPFKTGHFLLGSWLCPFCNQLNPAFCRFLSMLYYSSSRSIWTEGSVGLGESWESNDQNPCRLVVDDGLTVGKPKGNSHALPGRGPVMQPQIRDHSHREFQYLSNFPHWWSRNVLVMLWVDSTSQTKKQPTTACNSNKTFGKVNLSRWVGTHYMHDNCGRYYV